jgi:stage II sporulation protein D
MALAGSAYDEILAHYYRGTVLGQAPADAATIRVLLDSGVSGVSFVAGSGQVVSSNGGRRVSLRSGRSYRIARSGSSSVVLAGPGGSRTLPAPVDVQSGAGGTPVRYGAHRYRGALRLTPNGAGLAVVNVVDLESYLRGVVPSESPASWELEALKAQAVAARSYAITDRRGGSLFDVYGSTRSQVYGGYDAEDPRSDRAVAETAGLVMRSRGQVVRAFFFSTSGGRTAAIEDVFIGADPEPYLSSVPDPGDHISPLHRWGPMTYGAAALVSRLGGAPGSAIALVPLEVSHGRVVRAALRGTGGDRTITGPDIQARLGLRSTFFSCVTFDLRAGPGRAITGRVLGRSTVRVERMIGGAWKRWGTVRVGDGGAVRVPAASASAAVRYRLVGGMSPSPAVSIGPGKASGRPVFVADAPEPGDEGDVDTSEPPPPPASPPSGGTGAPAPPPPPRRSRSRSGG